MVAIALVALAALGCADSGWAKLKTKGYHVPGNPSQVAAAPAGTVYFTDVFETYKSTGLPVGSGPIRALDPKSGKLTSYRQTVEQSGGTTGAPYDLAFDDHGNLWFTEPALQRIGRLTLSGPDAGRVVRFEAGLPPSGDAEHPTYLTQIIAGPDGAMWFLDSGGNRLGRIAADGTVTATSLPGPPRNLVSGPLHSVWVSVGKQFLRVSTGGQISGFPAKPLGAGTLSASPQKDTLLSCSGKGLERISKEGMVSPRKKKGCAQNQILGPDGGLWASGGWYSGGVELAHHVYRTSPKSGRTKRFRVGKESGFVTGGNHQIAAAGRRLWMSDPSGRLVRITPP